ncbi:MAG: peptidase MA family metallohydrolase [Myxococcota bacterium]
MHPVGARILGLLGFLLLLAPGLAARDRGADGEFDQRRSAHFRLLQDVDLDWVTGRGGSRAFERAVLAELEQAYRDLARSLDIRPRHAIRVVIYDPGVFEQIFGGRFRFSAVGFYEGASQLIHIRGGTRVDAPLVRTLHHEYVHAALDAVTDPRRIPAWLNEGLAQLFEHRALGKRGLGSAEYEWLRRASANGAWLPLERLSGMSFASFDADDARLAYRQAYGLVDYLVRRSGERRFRSFMRQLVRGGRLERLFERELRIELAELEASFRAELR